MTSSQARTIFICIVSGEFQTVGGISPGQSTSGWLVRYHGQENRYIRWEEYILLNAHISARHNGGHHVR